MFRRFEKIIDPFVDADVVTPPDSLMAFYWHFIRQVWPSFVALLSIGVFAALIEVSLFAFLGKLVDLLKDASSPSAFLSEHSSLLAWMAFVAIILRPVVFGIHSLIKHQTIVPTFMNLVRWQNHRYVMRQSLAFFQNDFAGRIATKVMQTGSSLRESMLQIVEALWFVLIYAVSALALFFINDPLLTLPLLIWVALFIGILFYFIPKIKERAKILSEARSSANGQIVDSYTNVQTVKLFADAHGEDEQVRGVLAKLVNKIQLQMRLVTLFELSVVMINGMMIVSTCGLAIWLWSGGGITLGAIALATGLVLRINNMSQWVMWVVTGIFENIGTVQNGMETIAKKNELTDKPDAKILQVNQAQVQFDNISFHYGQNVADGAKGVVDHLSLVIKPGEKVGVVGRSGAGKSTLVNLLLRFYDLEGGSIFIDNQNIANVTQDSLRSQIGMVTQDTSLLHRSVIDNIRYGNANATKERVIAAAKLAQAHEFILELVDLQGRKGYEAHVGERGVKLSGGQRQRIAIARVLLKNAPILVLDEATSALDSEIEAAVQEQFDNLMRGKSVIAIAHRLSTIAAMDRLVVIDQGQIVEDGTHEELVAKSGIYAALWARQSGGFLAFEENAND
ncbi:MAG TPA: multidrug ABC transporter ATP-binding protein [Gammaproteobacteria bacterium]|nr:multidrug ABC transporter ATP-binding protein [Gammaproteobacteria bacterium]